jgi:hypothetical protein
VLALSDFRRRFIDYTPDEDDEVDPITAGAF